MKTDKPKATMFLQNLLGSQQQHRGYHTYQLYSFNLRFSRIVLVLVCLSRNVACRSTAKKAQMSLMLDGEKKATSKYFNCFTLAVSKRLAKGISYQQLQPQSMSICFTLSVSERSYAQPNFTFTKSIVLLPFLFFSEVIQFQNYFVYI